MDQLRAIGNKVQAKMGLRRRLELLQPPHEVREEQWS